MAIRSPDYLRRSKVYSWEKLTEWTNGTKIMPTDIEGVIERGSQFLYFEFKTVGSTMPTAQRLMYERRLNQDRSHGCMFLCEHPPVRETQVVSVPDDITGLTVVRYDEAAKSIQYTPNLNITERGVGWWLSQWLLHVDQKPNSFITTFRRHAKIYPGEPREESFGTVTDDRY